MSVQTCYTWHFCGTRVCLSQCCFTQQWCINDSKQNWTIISPYKMTKQILLVTAPNITWEERCEATIPDPKVIRLEYTPVELELKLSQWKLTFVDITNATSIPIGRFQVNAPLEHILSFMTVWPGIEPGTLSTLAEHWASRPNTTRVQIFDITYHNRSTM